MVLVVQKLPRGPSVAETLAVKPGALAERFQPTAAPGAHGSSGSITGGVHGAALLASSEQHSSLRSVHGN